MSKDPENRQEGPAPAPPPWHRRARLRTAMMLAALGLALVVPRALTLHGIEVAAIFEFADMADHLYFLDTMVKRELPGQSSDPFFSMFPETLPDRLAEQWTTGVYHVARLFAGSLGTGSLWTTLLTNTLFTLILLGAVIGLGASFGSLRVGLWGALLTALCPALVASTWYFSLDYPLLAMGIMGLYFLRLTRGFTCWRWVIAFAVWSALGTVIKPTYAIYVVGPAAWIMVAGLRRVTDRNSRLLIVARVAVGLVLSLALVYAIYRPNWAQIYNETRVHFVDRTLPGASIDAFTMEWILANIKMAMINFPYPIMALVLPGLALIHLRREGVDRGFWLSYLYSTYLFLTLLANKMERYIQPVYPVFCLLAAWAVIDRVPRRFQTPALLALVAAFGACLVTTHYNPTPWYFQQKDTIPQDSSFHPFRYEFHMPGDSGLARLRQMQHDSHCQIGPMLAQVKTWMAAAKGKRPWAMIYLRDPRRMTKMHPPVFFRRLIPALTLTMGDRIFIVPNLHEMPVVPVHLRHAPNVLIIHGPEIRKKDIPSPLQIKARRTLDITCMGKERFPFGLTWARPRPGSLGPRPGSPGPRLETPGPPRLPAQPHGGR